MRPYLKSPPTGCIWLAGAVYEVAKGIHRVTVDRVLEGMGGVPLNGYFWIDATTAPSSRDWDAAMKDGPAMYKTPLP